MRERRSVDLGIEARRVNAPPCDGFSLDTLARYVADSLAKRDRSAVKGHLRACDECRSMVETTCRLLTS